MRYFLNRIGRFAVVFVVVTFVVLMATRLGSTDYVRDVGGGAVGENVINQVKSDYPYLERSAWTQYPFWLWDAVVEQDLGRSYINGQTSFEMFQQRLPATFFIGFWAIVIGLVIAVPVGVYSAYRRDRLFDNASSLTSFVFISAPPLVMAVALLYLVVVRTDLFPTTAGADYVAPWDNPIEHFKNFFIPALSLGVGLGAIWSRLLRADMILTLQSDFITLARAKGVSPGRILWVHALRSSILSLVTSVALQISGLVGGAVVAEQFFGPKGIGDALVVAIQRNDVFTIQAITALVVMVVVVINLLVDLLYAVIDPRIRAARALG